MNIVHILFHLLRPLGSRALVNEEDAKAKNDGADDAKHAARNLLLAFKAINVSIGPFRSVDIVV